VSPKSLVRLSLASLLASILVAPLDFYLFLVVGRRRPGWDDLDDQLSVLVWGVVLVVVLLLGSAASGVAVARRKPIALSWTVPLLVVFGALLVATGAIGAGTLFGSGTHSDEMMGTAAAGLGATCLVMIAVWALDVGGWRRRRRVSWWLVGVLGFAATAIWLLVVSIVFGS